LKTALAFLTKEGRTRSKYDKIGVSQLLMLALERGDLVAAEKYEQLIESRPAMDRGARGLVRELLNAAVISLSRVGAQLKPLSLSDRR